MVSERDRILELQKYLLSLGISVNIGKNKARGNKGVFIRKFNNFRIDISKDVEENDIMSVILHEFAHYIHYLSDKNMSSLNFIFDDLTDELKEELIEITVKNVPKDFASALYSQKQCLKNEVKSLISQLKILYPKFKISKNNYDIEKKFDYPIKYLVKYDRIKYQGRLYSIEKLNEYNLTEVEELYLKIKSKHRALKRLCSKINRLNKYYNNPTELFARFVASYYTNKEYTEQKAPRACYYIKKSKNKYIERLNCIFY